MAVLDPPSTSFWCRAEHDLPKARRGLETRGFEGRPPARLAIARSVGELLHWESESVTRAEVAGGVANEAVGSSLLVTRVILPVLTAMHPQVQPDAPSGSSACTVRIIPVHRRDHRGAPPGSRRRSAGCIAVHRPDRRGALRVHRRALSGASRCSRRIVAMHQRVRRSAPDGSPRCTRRITLLHLPDRPGAPAEDGRPLRPIALESEDVPVTCENRTTLSSVFVPGH